MPLRVSRLWNQEGLRFPHVAVQVAISLQSAEHVSKFCNLQVDFYKSHRTLAKLARIWISKWRLLVHSAGLRLSAPDAWIWFFRLVRPIATFVCISRDFFYTCSRLVQRVLAMAKLPVRPSVYLSVAFRYPTIHASSVRSLGFLLSHVHSGW